MSRAVQLPVTPAQRFVDGINATYRLNSSIDEILVEDQIIGTAAASAKIRNPSRISS